MSVRAATSDGFSFSKENFEAAKTIVARYPQGYQAAAVLPLLDLAQRQNAGWLPRAAMDYVADLLAMPRIKVYEVATFYTMYNLEPVGRYHVQVCTNISCMLRDSESVVRACRETTGIGFGETSEDGMFTLSEVECLGACVNAPMMQIGDDYYEDLDYDSAKAILEALKRGERPKAGSQIGRQTSAPVGGPTTLTDRSPKAADTSADS